nr:MAG TPA: hypothetical protein [Caudoviricetes sp.]
MYRRAALALRVRAGLIRPKRRRTLRSGSGQTPSKR